MTFYNIWMKMSCYKTWNSVCCLLFMNSSLQSHPRHLREYGVRLLKLYRYTPDLRSTLLFCSCPASPRQHTWPDPMLTQPHHFHYYREPLSTPPLGILMLPLLLSATQRRILLLISYTASKTSKQMNKNQLFQLLPFTI